MPRSATGIVKINIIADSKRAVRELERIGVVSQSLSARMASAGRAMTFGLTVPLAAVGAASVKMALDFQDSMVKIKALVGASQRQMKQYESAIMSMSGRVAKSPKELADALYFVTSAGFKGAAALRVLEASAKASAAGLGDTATVADAVTSAVNAYGESALSATRATDIMLAAVREGKAEPADLAQSIGKVIPAASQMGVSFDQVAAAIAAMTLTGQSAEEAAVALNQVFMNSLKPQKQGAETLAKLGLSYKELRKSMQERGLLDTLEMLKQKFHGNVEEMAKVFGNARSLRAVLALTGAAGDKTATIFGKLAKNSHDTQKAFDEVSKTSGFKLKQAWADLQKVAIELGVELLPMVTDAAKELSRVLAWFDKLGPGTKHFAVQLGLVVAALGPVVWLTAKAIGVVKGLAAAYKAVATWATAAAVAEKVAGTGVSPAKVPGSMGSALAKYRSAGALAPAAAAGPIPVIIAAMAPIAAGVLAGALVSHYGRTQDTVAGRMAAQGLNPRTQQNPAVMRRLAAAAARPDISSVTDRMTLNAGTSDRALSRLWNTIGDIRKAAAKGIDLHINDKLTLAQMYRLRSTLIKQLGLTGKRADAILNGIFGKKYTIPKPNDRNLHRSLDASTAKVNRLKSRLDVIGGMRVSPQVNVVGNADSTLSRIWSKIGLIKDARLGIGTKAAGGIVTRPQLSLVGEAGPEAIIPLTRPRRAAEVMREAGLAGAGGYSTINVNVVVPAGTTLIGTAREVGDILAPHVARALTREAARAGRRR